jgi:hypothetical protein
MVTIIESLFPRDVVSVIGKEEWDGDILFFLLVTGTSRVVIFKKGGELEII